MNNWKCPECGTERYPILVNIISWRLYDHNLSDDEDSSNNDDYDNSITLSVDDMMDMDNDNKEDFIECIVCSTKFSYEVGANNDVVTINIGEYDGS